MFIGVGLGLTVGRGGFSPASLFGASDVGFFWDFTAAANLSQDSAGSTPVTAVTQPIGRCADLSGRGNHLTQATALARPTWALTAGGVGYADFNGSSLWMACTSFDWITDKATVVAVVRKLSDAASGTVVSSSGNFATNDGSWSMTAPNAATPSSSFGVKGVGVAAGTTAVSGFAAPVSSVLAGQADIAGDSIIHRRDGVEVATNVTDRGTGNFGNYQVFVGARGGLAQFFSGRIAALIGINRILTAAELAAVEAWGTARLPT